jgi:ABC-type antimicrobial peptide transport system permease subunit
MFRNIFTNVIRNLSRRLNYTIINIAGLTAGIAVCLLIFVIIRFETSFDNFHHDADRLYRVISEYHHQGDAQVSDGATVPAPLPSLIKTILPDLKKSSGVFASANDQVLIMDNTGKIEKKFMEPSGLFAVEPEFFDIFDFKWLAGDPHSSLKDPRSVVLTKEIAIKYFGDWKNAIGQTVNIDKTIIGKVRGILADVPANTDFQLKIVVPYGPVLGFSATSNWFNNNNNHGCYFLLPQGETPASIDKQMRAYADKVLPANDKDRFVIQPVSRVHFDESGQNLGNFLGKSISFEVINGLWIMAAFILLIACFNFINLATAQAVNRAREVGVRKALGSSKWQLRRLFLFETFLQVVLSIVMATVLTAAVVPPVGRLLDLPLFFSFFGDPVIPLFLFGLCLLVTFLAGLYPSILLSGYNAVEALKSKMSNPHMGGISLRRALVVFQFVIAQGLIIATVITIMQLNYFNNAPMGFDKDAVITVPVGPSTKNEKIDYLRNSLLSMPGIRSVTFNSTDPATDDNNYNQFTYNHDTTTSQMYSIQKIADAEYLPTYKIPLVAGRNFSSDTAHEFLVSETYVHDLNIRNPKDVLNKDMSVVGGTKYGKIVGVFKDYHCNGFKENYSRIVIFPYKPLFIFAGIKLNPGNPSATLAAISRLWNQTYPEFVFSYTFLDQSIANFYRQEDEQAALCKIFAGIAIFLSCLGLYGLASFMAIQRIKEVGIRKVLGASIQSIVYLFSREFTLLIVIAFVIASPIAWYFMHRWLEGYAFRITIGWWIFLGSGAASLAVALATVGFNAVKAARANPVRSLRTE